MGVELKVTVERESFQIVVRHLDICSCVCACLLCMRGAWWKEGRKEEESNRIELKLNGIYNEIQMECKQEAVKCHLRKHPLD